MLVGYKTDTGKTRDSNEDAYLADFPVYAVADGMGGHAAGEVASRLAINVLEANRTKLLKSRKPLELLKIVFEHANKKIIEKSSEIAAFGMGTTLTAAFIRKNKVYIAHAGDSRMYIANGPKLTQITYDHSLVQELVRAGRLSPEEANSHPNRNIITKALGIAPELKPDLLSTTLKPGDKILIVSDGITSMISDKQIINSLTKDLPPADTCDELIAKANGKGGLDNSTAVLITNIQEENRQEPKRGNKFIAYSEVAMALVVALGILLFFLASKFFVKLDEDKMALYQGHPGGIAGISFSRKLFQYDVRREAIPDWYIERLEEGISVDSRQEGLKAIDYVKSYSLSND